MDMTLKEIQNLIRFVAKSGASEVKLEMEDIKITIRTGTGSRSGATETTFIQHVPTAASPQEQMIAQSEEDTSVPVADEDRSSDDDFRYVTIKSPIIGTFYRKSAPDKPSFVEVGDTIKEGDVLCIIEAMKLFNEIESEVTGKIVKVLIDDSSPVEFDQPLFLVDPS